MLKRLQINLKDNWIFFTIILLFLFFVGGFISQYDRLIGHQLINTYHNSIGDTFLPYITHIGNGLTALIIILLLLIWRIEYGLLAICAFGVTAGITQFLKVFIFDDVQRPFLALWDFFHSDNSHLVLERSQMKVSNSFPSGHTTSAMSIFCALTLIFRKNGLGILFAIFAITASLSRVYLSQHFMEDVFSGTLIGVIGTLLVISKYEKVFHEKYAGQRLTIKRTFDFFSSLMVLLIGLPFFIIISLTILLTSKGGVFFRQQRVGLHNKDFGLFKFRTMKPNSEQLGQITVGGKDPRITKVGYFLRKYKLDEFPQLLNILKGDMSIVGPRPEVRKYVSLYNETQLKVLNAKPGLTDFASIEYMDENELLGKSENPDETYINEIMPAKLALNLKYIEQQSFLLDLKLIFRTIGKLFR